MTDLLITILKHEKDTYSLKIRLFQGIKLFMKFCSLGISFKTSVIAIAYTVDTKFV